MLSASRLWTVVCGWMVLSAAPAALAQTSVTVTADPGAAGQLRDARTGTVWTPQPPGVDNRLSHDNRLEPSNQPATPADRAFDPRSQVAVAEPLVVQRPSATLLGTVPIAAGPTVPAISLEGASLRAVPGDHWVTVLYVTNHSASPLAPQIGCTFTNGGRAVQEARVVLAAAGPGQRLGVPVSGPRTDVFVDRVLCRLLAP
jgi:hypothetical protein